MRFCFCVTTALGKCFLCLILRFPFGLSFFLSVFIHLPTCLVCLTLYLSFMPFVLCAFGEHVHFTHPHPIVPLTPWHTSIIRSVTSSGAPVTTDQTTWDSMVKILSSDSKFLELLLYHCEFNCRFVLPATSAIAMTAAWTNTIFLFIATCWIRIPALAGMQLRFILRCKAVNVDELTKQTNKQLPKRTYVLLPSIFLATATNWTRQVICMKVLGTADIVPSRHNIWQYPRYCHYKFTGLCRCAAHLAGQYKRQLSCQCRVFMYSRPASTDLLRFVFVFVFCLLYYCCFLDRLIACLSAVGDCFESPYKTP